MLAKSKPVRHLQPSAPRCAPLPHQPRRPERWLNNSRRFLCVLAFTAAKDFEANDGKAWEHCPGCREHRWFIPFDSTPRMPLRAPSPGEPE